MTLLARASINCKRQTRPLVREGAPYQQTLNCLSNKNLVLGPRCGLTPRQTGRLTVSLNITLTLTFTSSQTTPLVEEEAPFKNDIYLFENI
jgi:hypothetical protein